MASGTIATAGDTNGAGASNANGGNAGGMAVSGAVGGSSDNAFASGAGAGGAGASAEPLDYSIWLLQLPIGSGTSPSTVTSSILTSGYSSAYFYKATDGGQIFMDPATGITTSGSQHCRTELRESTLGGTQAGWAATGTNRMTASGKVLSVGGGASGTVTVGQVFNGTDSIPLCELEYSVSAGGFRLLYEEAKGAGTTTDLKTPVALNERYSFTLALTQGLLTVSINGAVAHAQTPNAATLGKKFYFKVGNYDQTSAAGAISETPYTTLEVYSIAVLHQ
jgi:hypothetical protein